MSPKSISLNSFFSHLEKENIHENIRLLLKYIISRKFDKTISISKERLGKIFTTRAMYKAFINLNIKHASRIYYSEHYIIMEIKYSYTRRSSYTETEVRVESAYLLGVDSERDTVFIEKLPRPYNLPSSYESSYEINDLEIVRTKDKVIQREVIGYDIDYDLDSDLNEEALLNRRIRVQGDLALTITTFVRQYREELLSRITDRVEFYFERELLRRIRDVLEIYGLNIEEEMSRLRIHGLKKNWSAGKRLEIMKVLGYIIYKELNISDLLKELELEDIKKDILTIVDNRFWGTECKVIISYKNRYSRVIEIVLEEYKVRGFGEELYDFIEITIKLDRDIFYGKALEILQDLERESILEFRDTRIRCGRHLILCKAKPVNLSFEYKLFGEDRQFEITNLPIVTKGELTFIHPQHNVKKLWFSKEVMVEPFIIENDRVFLRRLNKYTFEELVKKYLTQANKTLGVGNE